MHQLVHDPWEWGIKPLPSYEPGTAVVAKHMAFEIGFIPSGWRRGQLLTIVTPSASDPGFISLDSRELPETAFEAALVYEFAEATMVSVWLTWWATGAIQSRHVA